jgi:hypothetical protein
MDEQPVQWIWELWPGFDVVLTEHQLQQLSEIACEQVRHYCYFDPRNGTYVLSSDDGFTNHSENPNTTEDTRHVVCCCSRHRTGKGDHLGLPPVGWTSETRLNVSEVPESRETISNMIDDFLQGRTATLGPSVSPTAQRTRLVSW